MNDKNQMIPARLIRYLISLWISVLNIGIYFAFLIHGRWHPAKIIVVLLMPVAIGFSVHTSNAIIKLFREHQAEAENQVV